MFGLTAAPVIVLLGLGIDYYKGLSDKARLDTAADAAALAAISAAEQYISNNSQSQVDPQLTTNAEAAGAAQGLKAFRANAATTQLVAPATPVVDVTRPTGTQTFNATVTYSAQTPTSFGGIVGVNTMNINGASSSSLTLGQYLDFYLVVDTSGSMGLPTTSDGQNTLAVNNPDSGASGYHPIATTTTAGVTTKSGGCAFACHQSGAQGYSEARKLGVELRVDSVGNAVNAVLQTAQASQTLQNQFRIGIYPFIVHPIAAAQLSANYGSGSAAQSVATNLAANYLDTGADNYENTSPANPLGSAHANPNSIGYDGTHFENIWPDMNKYYLGPSGNGAQAASPKSFIFLVTDGMDNNQLSFAEAGKSGNGTTGSQPLSPDFTAYPQPYYANPPSTPAALKNEYKYPNLPNLPTGYPASGFLNACNAAKTAGYTIAVLYVPYITMPNPETNYNAEDYQVNQLLQQATAPQVLANSSVLQNCASSGFFFTADSPQDITNAMTAMFAQSLQAARLTQ